MAIEFRTFRGRFSTLTQMAGIPGWFQPHGSGTFPASLAIPGMEFGDPTRWMHPAPLRLGEVSGIGALVAALGPTATVLTVEVTIEGSGSGPWGAPKHHSLGLVDGAIPIGTPIVVDRPMVPSQTYSYTPEQYGITSDAAKTWLQNGHPRIELICSFLQEFANQGAVLGGEFVVHYQVDVPPPVPTITAMALSPSLIAVEWQGDGLFDLETDNASGSWTSPGRLLTGATAKSFSHEGLNGSTTYAYRVRASDAGGVSGWATTSATTLATDAVTLGTPENLRAIAGVDEVTLTWDPVPGVFSYRVWRGLAADSVRSIGTCTAPNYHDQSLREDPDPLFNRMLRRRPLRLFYRVQSIYTGASNPPPHDSALSDPADALLLLTRDRDDAHGEPMGRPWYANPIDAEDAAGHQICAIRGVKIPARLIKWVDGRPVCPDIQLETFE